MEIEARSTSFKVGEGDRQPVRENKYRHQSGQLPWCFISNLITCLSLVLKETRY